MPPMCPNSGPYISKRVNYKHHLSLSDSDRLRLVLMIWVGPLFLPTPHPYRPNGARLGNKGRTKILGAGVSGHEASHPATHTF